MPEPAGASGTRDRLLDAAISAISDLGVAGATTRRIAERAEVNEVTLFRQFGSKRGLIAAVLKHVLGDFLHAGGQPSGDVVADLEQLAATYVRFVDVYPDLVARVLPEVGRDPDLAAIVVPAQRRIADALRGIVEHHQRSGGLVEEPPEETIRAFMGPLLARATLAPVVDVTPLDVGRHVRRFLDGRAATPGGAAP